MLESFYIIKLCVTTQRVLCLLFLVVGQPWCFCIGHVARLLVESALLRHNTTSLGSATCMASCLICWGLGLLTTRSTNRPDMLLERITTAIAPQNIVIRAQHEDQIGELREDILYRDTHHASCGLRLHQPAFVSLPVFGQSSLTEFKPPSSQVPE